MPVPKISKHWKMHDITCVLRAAHLKNSEMHHSLNLITPITVQLTTAALLLKPLFKNMVDWLIDQLLTSLFLYRELMISFIIRSTSAWNACFSAFSCSSFICATLRPSNLIASSSLKYSAQIYITAKRRNDNAHEKLSLNNSSWCDHHFWLH